MIWFVRGAAFNYDGLKDAATIAAWVKSKGRKDFERVGCHILADKMKQASVNAIYFGEEKGELFESFWKIAHGNKAYTYYACQGSCSQVMGIRGDTGVMLNRDFDEPFLDYRGKSDVDSLS